VLNYNSASPMVGLDAFKAYYDGLGVTTYRLVNLSDKVPNVPNNLQHQYVYVPVGVEVSFNADYGAEAKNHDPCCCYGYALWNPTSPCNPNYDPCSSANKH
jgi:triacylglycerol lipase